MVYFLGRLGLFRGHGPSEVLRFGINDAHAVALPVSM